jgi:heat shock protein HtpX
MNNIKTTVLMVALTLMLVLVGALLGGKNGMTIALIIAFAMNFISYWFSDKIVLKMYRAKQITEAESPGIFATVKKLAQKADIPMPKVYIMEQEQPNAFATGRNPEHGSIALTTGIMRIMTDKEFEGVIAHELAHIKNRDMLVGTIAATIAGAISYLAQIAQWGMLFGGRDSENDKGGSTIAAIVMMIVGPIAALLVQMAISRSREYGADAGSAKITGNADGLTGALKKLQTASKQIPMKANPATSHMFIVNPLSGGGIIKLFSTHPPIEERVKRLMSINTELLK